MIYVLLILLFGLWAFVWYEFGYTQADLKESNRRIRDIYREIKIDIEKILIEIRECKKLIRDLEVNNEETIHRS